ncbi:MAG: TnpV protein [Clostridia bacterium]|nr:TnpV protein [Clostridia bacterium]
MMKITYTKQGDYQLPDLMLPSQEKQVQAKGKYAIMRLNYLKQEKKPLYTTLLMKDLLTEHLIEIQQQAEMRVKEIVSQMKVKENITEELKATDQMKWVGLMNNLQMTAEEIVANELIYA